MLICFIDLEEGVDKIFMDKILYNKLVRDKIPEIIKQSGKDYEVAVLPDEEYIKKLNEKLLEEVREYLESGSVEEIADISEVIYAILAYKNIGISDLERIRLEKLNTHGGFEKRFLLKEVCEI